MATVFSVNIQKGGVGKTTSVNELASCLAAKGYKVLTVDLDQQCNLSRMSGADLIGYYTIYEVLKGEVPIKDSIQTLKNYDICPSHKKFVGADKEFSEWDDIYKLSSCLKEIKEEYDYIVIDTPPNLGALPTMSLVAADYVIIPVEASSSGIQGLGALYEQIERIKDPERGANKKLHIAGLLLTMYTDRTVFSRQIKEEIKNIAKKMHTKVFDTQIRNSVVVKEAQSCRESLIDYNPKSNPAKDYEKFTDELLEDIRKDGK